MSIKRVKADIARCLLLLALFGTVPLSAISQVQPGVTSDSRVLLYDRDFAADVSLAARADQALVFTSDQVDSVGRFRLPAGIHHFCLSGGAGYFSSLSISDDAGDPVDTTVEAEGCVQANLQQGVATVRLNHSGPKIPRWVTASVRVDIRNSVPPPTALVEKSNGPVGGYWAIQDNTYNARGTFGNHVYVPRVNGAHMMVGQGDSFDDYSLIQLPRIDGVQTPAFLADPASRFSIILSSVWIGNECGYFCAYGPPPLLQIRDLGNYQFYFVVNPATDPVTLAGKIQPGSSDPVLWPERMSPADTFQVLFRYFPDGSQVGFLTVKNSGEIALYQECNRKGKAAVFIPLLGNGVVSPPYNLSALTSSVTTLNGTARSIGLSKGTGVYWGSNASDLQGAAVQRTADQCPDSKPAGLLFVEPLSDVLVKAHDVIPDKACEFCSLVNQAIQLPIGSHQADFKLWDFTLADFSYAVLTGLNFHDAAMEGDSFVGSHLTDVDLSVSEPRDVASATDFSGATLTRVNFTGRSVGSLIFKDATLSDIDLSGILSLSQVDFEGAHLDHVNLNGLDLSKLKLAGATLCGVNLTGADKDHILDLTGGNFAGLKVVLSSKCAANLSYTRFDAALDSTNSWSGMNLTGATVADLQGRVLSTKAKPLDLSAATLSGSTVQNAVLDYAVGLAEKDLAGIDLDKSSLRFVNLSGARLYGAKLNQANLEGANMNGVFLTRLHPADVIGASLEGAFLRNVNLSQAKLTGANFTNASFYSQAAVGSGLCLPDPKTGFTTTCATAASSTMDGTNFKGAYLFGVDFTNATATAVDFSGSFLTGTNFYGTTIAANPSGATGTFASAFLQGASLTGLTLRSGVSFDGAFVDFTADGNVINLILDGKHTTFPGYWNQPLGQPVCAQMTYNGPTTLPVTNQQTICPDGNQYAGGCGPPAVAGSKPNPNWKSDLDISLTASYLNDATYTPAPASGSPICNADFKWVPLSFRRLPPPRVAP